MGKSLEKKSFDDPFGALTLYELCSQFHKLPSEIKNEDNRDIEMMLTVMNAVTKHEQKGDRKQKREKLKKKFPGQSIER